MATSKTKASAAKKPATPRSKVSAKTVTAKNPPSTKVSAKVATPKKPVAPRTVVAKPAPKVAVAKKPAAPRAKKATAPRTAKPMPSPEQRYKMIEEAAYFLAEKNSFVGSSMEYWVTAEAQINAMIGGKQ